MVSHSPLGSASSRTPAKRMGRIVTRGSGWSMESSGRRCMSLMAIRCVSFRSGEATMAKKSSILLEADPGDPEDFPVDRAALDRAHMGRRIRRLRNSLGLTQEGFAERYGIPLSAIRQY